MRKITFMRCGSGNHNKASDYAAGTGKLNSVENFLKKAFKYAGLNYKKYLKGKNF